jgi:hypothetical protein
VSFALLIVVIAASRSVPAAPTYHAYATAPTTGATVAETEPVGPVTETVAAADFCAEPPPNVSVVPSALVLVTIPRRRP